jgi:hypothetical protein
VPGCCCLLFVCNFILFVNVSYLSPAVSTIAPSRMFINHYIVFMCQIVFLSAKTAYKVCEQWLTNFWNDCCGTDITRNGDSLTLPNSSWEKGGGPMKKLYIRSCYTAIISGIESDNKTHVLVRGTPGIGKSAFLFYYIYYVAKMNGDNVSICLTYLSSEGKCTAYLLRDNGVVTVSTTFLGVPDYHFSDSVDISTSGSSSKLTILFASIDEVHFKDFVKAKTTVGLGAWDIYMPLVELEELENMVPDDRGYTPESLQFRYDIMGGSVRNCLDGGQYSAPNEETSSNILEALELFFPDIDKAAQTWTVKTLGQHIDNLLSLEGAEHLKRSVFQHVYVDGTTFSKTSHSFCSNFMKYLCGRILESKNRNIQSRITELFGDCGVGVMFAAVAFDAILKHLQDKNEYTMYNLKPQAKVGNPKANHKMVFVTPHTNLTTFQRCKNMPDIQQFVMCHEAAASSDVIGSPRKKRKGSHSGK